MNTPQDCLDSLQWRYACKKFDPTKKIDEATWQALAESLRLSASSIGMQPWKFIDITSAELKQKLRPESWNQSQVTDCDHYVVLCAKRDITMDDVERHLANIAKIRQCSAEKIEGSRQFYGGYVSQMTPEFIYRWTESQVHIALGFVLSAAAALRVDSCTIGGLDREKYDEILGLTDSPYRTVLAVALGYRAADDAYAQEKKVRYPMDEVMEKRA